MDINVSCFCQVCALVSGGFRRPPDLVFYVVPLDINIIVYAICTSYIYRCTAHRCTVHLSAQIISCTCYNYVSWFVNSAIYEHMYYITYLHSYIRVTLGAVRSGLVAGFGGGQECDACSGPCLVKSSQRPGVEWFIGWSLPPALSLDCQRHQMPYMKVTMGAGNLVRPLSPWLACDPG